MDLREYIRSHPDVVFGHKPVEEPLNVKKELSKYSQNKYLQKFISKIKKRDSDFFLDQIGRFKQSYYWYIQSLERVLIHASLLRRYNQEIKYHRKNKSFSKRQMFLNRRCRDYLPYMELDFQNLLIHSIILLNRSLEISRTFIQGTSSPSFTSFADHKKFIKTNGLDSSMISYSNYILTETAWFEIPLKVLRDKYLMHSSEKHISFLGWPNGNYWNLELQVILSKEKNFTLGSVKVICFNPRRLAHDVHEYLSFISKFGLQRL